MPVCAPGYSLLLAPLVWAAGPVAVHAVPPLAAAAVVWLSFVLGRRLHSPWAGVMAAIFVAVHPIVVFQAVQPMNDITTGAIWLAGTAAALAARPVATGTLVGLGLLVRPNLAPAGAMVLLTLLWQVVRMTQPGKWARVVTAAWQAGLATLPGVVVAMGLNAALYGSPLRSGYGDLGVLFSPAHVPVNVTQYGLTWLRTSSPLVLLALLAPWVVSRERRSEVWAVAGVLFGLSVIYLAYRPFPEWWYLRFLLPAVVLSLVLTAVAMGALLERVPPLVAVPAAMLVVAGTLLWVHGRSETRDAFGLQALESRFPLAAALVADRLPPAAVAITVWQSGGLRFWPGREVLVWDSLEPEWLDRAVDWLTARRQPPVIVVEQWEEEGFRRHFAGQRYGALDWPPRFAVGRRVRIFVPEDRERYLRGEAVETETVFAPR